MRLIPQARIVQDLDTTQQPYDREAQTGDRTNSQSLREKFPSYGFISAPLGMASALSKPNRQLKLITNLFRLLRAITFGDNSYFASGECRCVRISDTRGSAGSHRY
jgi:hypothetical protein